MLMFVINTTAQVVWGIFRVLYINKFYRAYDFYYNYILWNYERFFTLPVGFSSNM